MPELPQPPANLMDWLILLGLIVAAIEGVRRRLLKPFMLMAEKHAREHEESREARIVLMEQLAPNGSEWKLPGDLQNKPLRQLTISAINDIKDVQKRQAAHGTYTKQTLAEMNADRVARNLPPIPGEDGE